MINIDKLKMEELIKLHQQLERKKKLSGLTKEEAQKFEQIKDVLLSLIHI